MHYRNGRNFVARLVQQKDLPAGKFAVKVVKYNVVLASYGYKMFTHYLMSIIGMKRESVQFKSNF